MISVGTLFALLGLGFATSHANAASPAISEVYVNDISINGAGCAVGTVSYEISNENKLKIFFEDFQAEDGPGIRRQEMRKHCQISFDLHVPLGWQYTLASVTSTGFADVDNGAHVKLTSEYYFSGDVNNIVKFNSTIRGSFVGDFAITDEANTGDELWSPCNLNRSLNLKSTIQASAKDSLSAFISLDSVDVGGAYEYGLKWRRCN